jgi:hypothetical protein
MQTTVPNPTEADRHAIEEVIRRHEPELPQDIRRIETEYGEDWTGYPTVRLNFIVAKGAESKQDLNKAVNDFNNPLADEIIALRSYWPSVRLITED